MDGTGCPGKPWKEGHSEARATWFDLNGTLLRGFSAFSCLFVFWYAPSVDGFGLLGDLWRSLGPWVMGPLGAKKEKRACWSSPATSIKGSVFPRVFIQIQRNHHHSIRRRHRIKTNLFSSF